jgi:redox-sensitive bicupin YhaK (pirin superfamily)
MEIITVMVEGALQHRDSLGHTELLRAGEVQRMSAGTGVVHSEMNSGDQACRLLQIWIEPGQLGTPPAYEQKPFAIGPGWTPLLDPARAAGAMAIQRSVRLWRARPGAGDSLALPLAEGRAAWLQLIDGAITAPLPLQRGDGLGFTEGELTQPLLADASGADLLLFELA